MVSATAQAQRGRRVLSPGRVPTLGPLRWVLAALALCLLAASPTPAAADPHDAQAAAIVGNWLTAARDGIIQISQTPDGRFEGRIVGGDSPERLDTQNPDPTHHTDKLLGLVILRNLKYLGHARWAGGTIYDPDSGHTYHCRLELLGPDRLKVRGFLGVALLGRSQVWTRYRGSSMVLPPSRR